MTLGSRLAALMENKSISQSALAREIGVSQQTIGKLVRGDSLSSVHLHRIARALETNVDYLLGDTDDPAPASLALRRPTHRAPIVEHGDTVEVAVSDVSYGMGGAFVDDSVSQTSIERFPRSFIRLFTRGPFAQLYFATGIGDSMQPTIHHNDLVLIDRSQDALRVSDQLWAISTGSIGMIKRVRVIPSGSVLLVSDNQDVSDYAVGEDELHLIGRVVAVIKRL